MLWPVMNLDKSSIQHVCGILVKRVRRRTPLPWSSVSLVRSRKRNGEGPLRSPYVYLLGAHIDAVLLSMPIETDIHVKNDV